MIKNLRIENYKSVKELDLKCNRINLFIGEPNVGKSNILEALALYSLPYLKEFKDLVRFQDSINLFSENDPSNQINIISENGNFNIVFDSGADQIVANFPNNLQLRFSINGKWFNQNLGIVDDLKVRPYFFKALTEFKNKRIDFLAPPNGNNLFSILQSNKHLRQVVSDFVKGRGFKLTFRQATSDIEISKEENNILTTYPYQIISDTLQRMIFFLSAMESNGDGTTLLFEEPESNVFPYYTNFLAERIAIDSGKQYFISTHNPYFLQSIIEKTPSNDLQVSIVQMQNFQTKVVSLSEKTRSQILDLNSDVFLNFDKLLEE